MSEKISLGERPVAEAPQAVPSEAIAIPSEGKLYPEGHPLCDKQFIMIRPMTARDEDILTSRALFKTGKVVDTLLRSCIVDKLDPSTMLVGDRNAAIVGIRVSGYGAEYQTKLECPACGGISPVEVDLGSLPLTNIPDDVSPVSPHTNEFAFKTPSGLNVTFRLPTGNDEQEMSSIIDRMRKTTGAENLVTTRLMQQVISINGETDRTKLSNMIRNMPAKDSRELRYHMDYVAPDVRLVREFTCPQCETLTEEVSVPLGTEFFWPKAGR